MATGLWSERDIAFRAVIKGAMAERGWTAKRLSIAMGKSDNFFSKFVKGEREMGHREFERLCDLLEFRPQEIYDRRDVYLQKMKDGKANEAEEPTPR